LSRIFGQPLRQEGADLVSQWLKAGGERWRAELIKEIHW